MGNESTEVLNVEFHVPHRHTRLLLQVWLLPPLRVVGGPQAVQMLPPHQCEPLHFHS